MRRTRTSFYKKVAGVVLSGAVVFGAYGIAGIATPAANAAQSTAAKLTSEQQKMALDTLMSFYKPALEGHFPTDSAVGSFVVGKTTRDEVLKAIGKAEQPRATASGFDVYHAEMGHPGYALAYNDKNILQEIRYFGTNVERETNIGGMTMSMLKQHWFAPSSTNAISNTKQIKWTYIRGDYKLEFIFNSTANLDHINLKRHSK
ncbi:YjgB family protein [Paenibacillus sp. 1001270B_150601_E10]|uniref:YjgB family protein n=1 Tax=Paenibacillus sp. 1001270B_150601_E10 TaxID=2787079 RepID=UPI00189F65B7|nr:YjgB family protein [Paenibacillus sp. 1001270B_150601_E10]